MLRLWATAALAFTVLAAGAGAEDLVWELETWEVPFDYSSRSRPVRYVPLEKATKKWRICASYPHLKDSYWLSVNYGMVLEAERLGVALQLVEAGGYPNLARQIAQVRECTAEGADILVVGTVSFEGLTPTVQEIAERIPVTAVVNDIADPGISAKAGVSWTIMGSSIGEHLARRHPEGSPPVKIAWFPGPEGSGWVPFVEAGFHKALEQSSAEIVVTKYGDTGREIQLILLEEALEERPDVDYIVGSAVTAEAAVSALRARGLLGQIRILADYFTHAVHPCGVPRHQAPAHPGRTYGLPGHSGSTGYRTGGTPARGQARAHPRGPGDKARGYRQRRRARHRDIPGSGLVHPEVHRRVASGQPAVAR